MAIVKSKLCKTFAYTIMFSGIVLFTNCGDSSQTSESVSTDSSQVSGTDTVHTGLEGTHEQQSSLSTDVNVDTSSGQGKQNDSAAKKDPMQKK